MVHSFVAKMPATPEKSAELKEETEEDESLHALQKQITYVWPDHVLSKADGLLFNEQRVIIPRASSL